MFQKQAEIEQTPGQRLEQYRKYIKNKTYENDNINDSQLIKDIITNLLSNNYNNNLDLILNGLKKLFEKQNRFSKSSETRASSQLQKQIIFLAKHGYVECIYLLVKGLNEGSYGFTKNQKQACSCIIANEKHFKTTIDLSGFSAHLPKNTSIKDYRNIFFTNYFAIKEQIKKSPKEPNIDTPLLKKTTKSYYCCF